jgi:hypothetical protein
VAALADATPEDKPHQVVINDTLVNNIQAAYQKDPWCIQLLSAACRMPKLMIKDGLWFIGECLIVPTGCDAWEQIFRIAHDTLGHFEFFKTYRSLQNSYFWPNMRKDLEGRYIPSCVDCQHNKNSTTKPAGPLHPLPIPDKRGDSVAMDFIGPLPKENSFDCILTMTD